jgi:hypothetical protein
MFLKRMYADMVVHGEKAHEKKAKMWVKLKIIVWNSLLLEHQKTMQKWAKKTLT